MSCGDCHVECQRFGKHRNGLRRFRCQQCKRTFTEPHTRTLGEMYISQEKMSAAVQLLIEGNSVRSVERITGWIKAILRVLVLAGEKCEKIMSKRVRNIAVKDVECDEVWSYIGKKEAHKRLAKKPLKG